MIARTLKPILSNHLLKHKKGLLILGPRQVGKSTLIKSLKPDLQINLIDEAQYRSHLKDPELIKRQVMAYKKGLFFVDEIQRIPSMLNTIQGLIDDHPEYRFVITGSSARKLKKGPINLLPGRLFSNQMFPLTYWEVIDQFDLDRAIRLGGLPEIYLQEYGKDLLRDYVGLYLREEIQAEALVRNLESFNRFLDVAAEASGQIINYTKISSDSEIPKETIRRFYDILEDTLIIYRIPGFRNFKSSRKVLQREKILFFDLGVRNAILNRQDDHFSQEEQGLLFEQWFIQQIIAYQNYTNQNWKLSYYRDDLKNEIDLLIETPKKIYAIEVKSSKKIKSDFLKSLNFFETVSKMPTKSYIVFQGSHNEKWESVEAVPYQEFLKNISSYLK